MSAKRQPLVIAHRGASGELPENTLPAYERAVEQRADMIEVDLHRTKDGVIVVTHDELLAGLGGSGEIADATLAEVRALDAGGGERVPALDEVLDRFGARIPFNLEIKCGTRGAYPGLEAAVLGALEQRGLLARTLFSSFYDGVLARLRELSPHARTALLLSRRSAARALERARGLGAEAINPERSLADERLVGDAHAAGFAVYCYTVDAPDEMRRLIGLGVDGLFTNFPKRLREIVGPRGDP